MIACLRLNYPQGNSFILAMAVSAAAVLHASTLIVRMFEAPAPVVRAELPPDSLYRHQIALVDREGRIVTTTDRLGTPDPQFVAAVRRAIAGDRA